MTNLSGWGNGGSGGSMSTGRSFSKGEDIIAVVKKIDNGPNRKEQKVTVKADGARKEDAIYVPRRYSNQLKPEHKYSFHLEETSFRGGGQARFSGSAMIRRTRQEPEEVTETGFGGHSKGGGNGFRNL